MKTKVSVLKCDSYDEKLVYNAVKKSLSDINFKFKKNSTVLIKPNILSQNKPENYITTHPTILDAICKILKENNCKIIIGDSSGFYKEGGTKLAMKVSGIEEIAKKNKAELIPFEEAEIKKIKDNNAKILKEINIAKPVLEADLVINVPKLKTHSLMVFTGGVKNLLGTLPGGLKQKCHLIAKRDKEFGNLLLDIYQNIKPGLNIMDGVIGIEGEGPGTGGTPIKTGYILASENAIALDIVAQRITGMNPEEIVTTRDAIKRGLFSNYNDVEIIGEFVTVPYKKPMRFIRKVPTFLKDIPFKQAIVFPYINKEKCKKCMVCVDMCPTKTIKLRNNFVFIEKKGCINCYCCHELCPYNAITMKSSMLIEIAGKVRDIILKKKKK